MSMFPSASNPIVYAQFNLQGRWMRMLIVAGSYGLLIAGAIWLTTLSDNFHPRDLEGWVSGLTALQGLTLLVFGSFRVETAVRGDVSSRMIESHRLMPASPLGSILGYIFGAPLQAFLLAIVNLILGGVCCQIAGLPKDVWLLVNGTLLFFALFIYSMIMQFSFIARGGFLILLIVGALAITAGVNGGLPLIPSAMVLLFPMLSRDSIFEQLLNKSAASVFASVFFPFATAIIAQGIIAGVAIRAGIRRYLSSSVVGISPPLGLILLATWVGLAIVYFAVPELFRSRRYYGYQDGERVAQIVVTLASSFLLAVFPIASAARSYRQLQQGADPLEGTNRSSRELWTRIAATGIISLLLIDLPVQSENPVRIWSLTLLLLFNFLSALAWIFAWGYLGKRRAWIYAAIWIVITWVGPVVADGVYRAMTDDNGNATWITAISPAGALALIWSGSPVNCMPGVFGQLILTLLPLGLILLAKHKSPAD